MPTHPLSPGERFRSWDGKCTGTTKDATRRTEIEARIRARKPLRIADKAYLRDELHVTVLIKDGQDLLE